MRGNLMLGSTFENSNFPSGNYVGARPENLPAKSSSNKTQASAPCPCDCEEISSPVKMYVSKTPTAGSEPFTITRSKRVCDPVESQSIAMEEVPCEEVQGAVTSLGSLRGGCGCGGKCGGNCGCGGGIRGLGNAGETIDTPLPDLPNQNNQTGSAVNYSPIKNCSDFRTGSLPKVAVAVAGLVGISWLLTK